MDTLHLVNEYLAAFWSGDFDRARSLVADDFSFRGPLAQADDKAAFFASAAPLASVVRGHELLRQWTDGDTVCSMYRCRLETARGAGSVLVAEWDTVREDRVVAAKLVFDTAAFRALLPPPPERVEAAVALARAHLEAWTNQDLETVRANLAEDVQFYSPAAQLVGIYMAPRPDVTAACESE